MTDLSRYLSAATIVAALSLLPAAAQTAGGQTDHPDGVTLGHRPHPAAQLSEMPPARLVGPDVADHL